MNKIKLSKKVIANIEKCYSVCPITIRGTQGFLIGTEKAGGCFFFDLAGNLIETVWDDPGGIMSMVPTHQREGEFLSTQEFYSPNDSKNARIVLATPTDEGWRIKTVADLPFVHRFDIIPTPDQDYIIACTLKSGLEYKEDWTHPGKVYVCPVPEDLSSTDQPLMFEVLVEGLTRNHGYYRIQDGERAFALVSSQDGVYKVTPPHSKGADWQYEKILDQATSDATLIDLDEDGQPELLTLSPFHGEDLRVFRLVDGKFVLDYTYPEKLEFLHAIWSGKIHGQPMVILGHRKGNRDLFALTYDKAQKTYVRQILDEERGPANVTFIDADDQQVIVATNRETNEVAMYVLEN